MILKGTRRPETARMRGQQGGRMEGQCYVSPDVKTYYKTIGHRDTET